MSTADRPTVTDDTRAALTLAAYLIERNRR